MKKRYGLIITVLLATLVIGSCTNKKRVLFSKNKNTNTELDSLIVTNVQPPPILKVKSNDILEVSILTKTEVSNIAFVGTFELPINQDGVLKIPKLGEFKVANKSTDEIEDLILKKAETILESPEVSVAIESYTIQVLGSVFSPGIKVIKGGIPINIIQAIGAAGSLSEDANASKIKVLRREGDLIKSYTVDLTSLDAFNSKVLYIQSGDIVYVPQTNTINVLKATTLINAASILINTIILLSR